MRLYRDQVWLRIQLLEKTDHLLLLVRQQQLI